MALTFDDRAKVQKAIMKVSRTPYSHIVLHDDEYEAEVVLG